MEERGGDGEEEREGGREKEKKERRRNAGESAYQHGYMKQPPSMECVHYHSDVLRQLLVTTRWSPLPQTHHNMRM